MCSKEIRIAAIAAFAACFSLLGATKYSLEECYRLSREGNAEARWQLGQRYENGDGVARNLMRAVVQYKRAAEAGHAEACVKLAAMYRDGTGVAKDPVEAARYEAMAKGEDVKAAVLEAEDDKKKSKGDEIELALDYILGRNGKAKDVKTGVRMLYASAKDDPVAQEVFVKQWCKANLNGGLQTIDAEDWELVVPWFKESFRKGNAEAGYIVGLFEFLKGNYEETIRYWKRTSDARAWKWIAKIYDPETPNEWGDGENESERNDPTARFKSRTKAIEAWKRVVKLSPNDMNGWSSLFVAIINGERCGLKDLQFICKKSADLVDKCQNEDDAKWMRYCRAFSALKQSQFDRTLDVYHCLCEYLRAVKLEKGRIDRDVEMKKWSKRIAKAEEWEKKYLGILQDNARLGHELSRKYLDRHYKAMAERDKIIEQIAEAEKAQAQERVRRKTRFGNVTIYNY